MFRILKPNHLPCISSSELFSCTMFSSPLQYEKTHFVTSGREGSAWLAQPQWCQELQFATHLWNAMSFLICTSKETSHSQRWHRWRNWVAICIILMFRLCAFTVLQICYTLINSSWIFLERLFLFSSRQPVVFVAFFMVIILLQLEYCKTLRSTVSSDT